MATTDGGGWFRRVLGLACLFAALASSVLSPPDWSLSRLIEPVYLASLACIPVVAFSLLAQLRKGRGSRTERGLLAGFLFGMPLVYTANTLRVASAKELGLQLLGCLMFGVVAWLGLVRSVWFLCAGILAHGLLWDALHHLRGEVVPTWYALGCLVVDVCIGAYLALEAPHFDTFATRTKHL